MQLLYIHGFNSSPQSFKAQATQTWLQANYPADSFACPQLSNYPLQAMAQLETLVANAEQPLGLVGSSMGGYYATYLSEKYDLPAVLINPAVRPYDRLREYLGENSNYHTGDTWQFEESHIEEFRQFDVEPLQRPANLWALLQEGDEVLDYRQAVDKYEACRLTVEADGDHSFQGYERYLPEIYQFLLDV